MNFLQNLFGGIGNLGSSLGSSLMGMFGGGQGGNQPAQTAGGGGGNGLFGGFNPGMTGAGLGIMGLGHLLQPKVNMPDFQSMPQIQQLSNWQNSASHPLDPNVAQSIQNTLDIQNEQQLRNLRDVYKNLRPGTDYTTDSNYQRDLANLNRQMSMTGADAMAGAQLQSNQQQLGNLTNMAQLGVGQGMGEAAMKGQKAQQQNQMFGDIGSMFLQRGLGMPSFMDAFTGLNNFSGMPQGGAYPPNTVGRRANSSTQGMGV